MLFRSRTVRPLDTLFFATRDLLDPAAAQYARAWGAPMAYLYALQQKRMFVCEKSRQVMMTWVVMAYICWRAKFNEHQLILVQSKKAEDAQRLVCTRRGEPLNARLTLMEAKLPAFLQSIPLNSDRAIKGQVFYPNASEVWAIPEGGGQIRSHTPSVYFCDEAAFQPEFSEGYRAALPLIANGCQGIFVSSAEVGAFQLLVESDLDPSHTRVSQN